MQTVGLTSTDVMKGDVVRGVDDDIPNEGITGLVDRVDTPMEATAATI